MTPPLRQNLVKPRGGVTYLWGLEQILRRDFRLAGAKIPLNFGRLRRFLTTCNVKYPKFWLPAALSDHNMQLQISHSRRRRPKILVFEGAIYWLASILPTSKVHPNRKRRRRPKFGVFGLHFTRGHRFHPQVKCNPTQFWLRRPPHK